MRSVENESVLFRILFSQNSQPARHATRDRGVAAGLEFHVLHLGIGAEIADGVADGVVGLLIQKSVEVEKILQGRVLLPDELLAAHLNLVAGLWPEIGLARHLFLAERVDRA